MLGPIVFVVTTAFTSGSVLEFPPRGFSLRWFAQALNYQPFLDSLVTSTELALAATALSLAVGVPATLAIHRGRLPGRGVVQALYLSPLIVPELVVGLALFQQLVVTLHLENFAALLLGHAVLLLPYAVRVTGATLANLGPSLEEAARGLGASPLYTFRTITVPALRPGLVSAAILGFVTSFNNVPVSLLLQGGGSATLPVTMLGYVQQNYDPMVAATSTLLLAVTVVLALGTERLVGFHRILGGINQ